MRGCFYLIKVESNYLEWSNEINPNDGVKRGSVLFSVDGKVNDIFLILDENSNFSVKNLFEILGEPSWVDTNWGGPVQPEKPCFVFCLNSQIKVFGQIWTQEMNPKESGKINWCQF